MDAREALRRYLEQRREMGDSELTLDTLNVDEALRLLGAPSGAKARRTAAPPDQREPGEHVWGKASVPDVRASQESRPQDVPAGGAAAADRAPAERTPEPMDWREAVRAAGGAPEPPEPHIPMPRKSADRPAAPATHVPDTQVGATAESPLEDVPAGLSVGGASRAIFDDPAFKLETLEEIAATVAGCRRCPLYATAINPVPGAGHPNADFMIVGEAPGASEDEAGVPFVGASGQLLTKIIGAINLGRDDVFIANVLKHRPPGNRNPLPEEVAACSPYLVRQIELVKPKVILALGTFAAQTLLETKLTIGKLRGQVHRYYGVPLIVTYHPAALLRNPAWKRPTWEDVQLARRILDRAQPAGS
jgi:uracil-DNA glycosylase family 4